MLLFMPFRAVIETYADQVSYLLIIGGSRRATIHFVNKQAVIFVYPLFKIGTIFGWKSGAEAGLW